ncbi:predicted protein [Botrytis cinerea T4]|uniref:Uncharacterized protein n=1 Tax=Botryotinia fuckeliana (strain T4) TaxID=999810 RepID=G2Y6U5_BOTF4|nr:predicted protein [Botrytis cinerea T4]
MFSTSWDTNTCKCSRGSRLPASSFTKDEVCKIMEEKQDMIERLENLTAEFEKNLGNPGKLLHAFLIDNWKPRIEEIMTESKNEEHMENVRELGVIIR